jgi:hypothetical protein
MTSRLTFYQAIKIWTAIKFGVKIAASRKYCQDKNRSSRNLSVKGGSKRPAGHNFGCSLGARAVRAGSIGWDTPGPGEGAELPPEKAGGVTPRSSHREIRALWFPAEDRPDPQATDALGRQLSRTYPHLGRLSITEGLHRRRSSKMDHPASAANGEPDGAISPPIFPPHSSERGRRLPLEVRPAKAIRAA